MALKLVKYYGSLQPQIVIAHIIVPRVKTKFVDSLQDQELKRHFNHTIHSSSDKRFKGTNPQSMEDKLPVDYDTLSTIDQLRGELNYNSLIAALSHGTFAKGSTSNNEYPTPPLVDDLQLYLSDPIEEPYLSNNQQFDILKWLRENEHKYPKLAPMASLFLGTKCRLSNNIIIFLINISLSLFYY